MRFSVHGGVGVRVLAGYFALSLFEGALVVLDRRDERLDALASR
ncbi:MAG TPA: hypothetical protein VHX14_05915 [Thermoanaerobaculia bacterium]|nr:hypothetical protein [Thermoanaerobaculia bacterium]